MSDIAPIDTIGDLQRLALNAGRYGVVTVSAHALLEVIGDLTEMTGSDLEDAIAEAEDMADRAEAAAEDAQAAADELQALISKARKSRQ